MNTYLLVSAIAFLALGIIWNKNDFLNWIVKVFLLLLGITGFAYYLISIGYIVKS